MGNLAAAGSERSVAVRSGRFARSSPIRELYTALRSVCVLIRAPIRSYDNGSMSGGAAGAVQSAVDPQRTAGMPETSPEKDLPGRVGGG